MNFWDPLGGKQDFSLVMFWRAITHRNFTVFACLTLLFFFATDPSSNRAYVPLWVSAAIWPIAYVIYLSIYACLLCVLSTLTSLWPRLRTPTSLVGFLALYPTVFISEVQLIDYFSNGTYPHSLGGKYLFYFLSVQVSEAVFFRYIYPHMQDDLRGVAAAKQLEDVEDDTKHVIIGGERIRLDDIHAIEAQEHHVQVTLRDSERRLRARLGDVVAQTTANDGVQPHRSWWVARHAARALGEVDGRPVLHLKGDVRIPIARTRVTEVQSWVSQHLSSDTCTKSPAE